MKEEIQTLIKNTKLLNELFNSSLSGLEKYDILSQIEHNLELLQKNLSTSEFAKEVGEISDKAKKIRSKLTDPSFIKKLQNILQGIKFKL